MTEMPMFPLGSVLFPYMPLGLRLFEERYLVMLASMVDSERDLFGVVLIERGQEVGGGEKRFAYGTVAQIAELSAQDGSVGLIARGGQRLEVVEWKDELPYPRAEIRELDELVWDDSHLELLDRAEAEVRRCLAVASEFGEVAWPSDVAVSDDPVEASWQLAAISPLGPLDQISLLRSTSIDELLTHLLDYTEAAREAFNHFWPADDAGEGDAGVEGNDFPRL